MSEQESIIAKYSEDGSITFGDETIKFPAPPPPDKILMRDETGQEWALSVRPDGQLRTEKRLGESESLGIE